MLSSRVAAFNARKVPSRDVRTRAKAGGASRRNLAFVSLSLLVAAALPAAAAEFADAKSMNLLSRKGEYNLSDEEWKQRLSPSQYSILRKANTERPFVSPLNDEKRTGTFTCAGCGANLFASSTKFESGTGWPSFFKPLPGAVDQLPDLSIIFLPRTEVRCSRCKGHLGHVFDDGPKPTGQRYCLNGLALGFEPSSA